MSGCAWDRVGSTHTGLGTICIWYGMEMHPDPRVVLCPVYVHAPEQRREVALRSTAPPSQTHNEL
jgi:hypothetical protein